MTSSSVILGDVRARHAFLATRPTFTEKLGFRPSHVAYEQDRTSSASSMKSFCFLREGYGGRTNRPALSIRCIP